MGFPNTFKALADPVRRDILLSLKQKSLTAGEIAEKYDLSNSTISYHLSLLKKAGLVKRKKADYENNGGGNGICGFEFKRAFGAA